MIKFYKINPHLIFNFLKLKKFSSLPTDIKLLEENTIYNINDKEYYIYTFIGKFWTKLNRVFVKLSEVLNVENITANSKEDLLFNLNIKDPSKFDSVEVSQNEEITKEELDNFYDIFDLKDKTKVRFYFYEQKWINKEWLISFQDDPNKDLIENIIVSFYDNKHEMILGSYKILENNTISCTFKNGNSYSGSALVFFIYSENCINNYSITKRRVKTIYPLGTIIHSKEEDIDTSKWFKITNNPLQLILSDKDDYEDFLNLYNINFNKTTIEITKVAESVIKTQPLNNGIDKELVFNEELNEYEEIENRSNYIYRSSFDNNPYQAFIRKDLEIEPYSIIPILSSNSSSNLGYAICSSNYNISTSDAYHLFDHKSGEYDYWSPKTKSNEYVGFIFKNNEQFVPISYIIKYCNSEKYANPTTFKLQGLKNNPNLINNQDDNSNELEWEDIHIVNTSIGQLSPGQELNYNIDVNNQKSYYGFRLYLLSGDGNETYVQLDNLYIYGLTKEEYEAINYKCSLNIFQPNLDDIVRDYDISENILIEPDENNI